MNIFLTLTSYHEVLMNTSSFKQILKGRENKSKETTVKQEELALVRDITTKFRNAKAAKQKYVATWDKCIAAYNSDYFKNKSRPDYKSDEISNFIFSTLETIKPIMVDNDPRILVLPKTPDGVEVVDKVQNVFDAEWIRTGMSKKLQQGITISLQIGTAIYGVFWDGKDENGLGNVRIDLINPYNFFPDPMATDIDNGEYYIYATYKQINQLKQAFPDKADLIRGGQINHPELAVNGDTTGVTNQVLVLECYMRDYTVIETEQIDPEDETKKLKKMSKKYPRGRVVTIAPELDLLLSDKHLPYKDGKFPFKLLKCYDVPFEFWGKGEVEQLLSPQTYINELMNQIIDNAKLTANMPWVIDKNSGIGRGQLTNRPGLIVRKNPGSDVKRLAPPPMPAYVQEIIQTLKNDIEIISGVHEVTQGRKPGSVSAASAIAALQEAAQARIRLKVKLMELTLGELGTMWYERIQQYWVTNRWIRRSDIAESVEATIDPDFAFEQVTPEDLEVNVDFVVLAGSTMPQNKNAMLDQMIRLAQTPGEDGFPMIDRETLLTYTSLPNKKKIVQKFSQLGQQRAEAQAQAAQMEMKAIQETQKQKMAIAMMQQQGQQNKVNAQQQLQAQIEAAKIQDKQMQRQHDAQEGQAKRELAMTQQQIKLIVDIVMEELRKQGNPVSNNMANNLF
jgi:hypothetical protein